jgi:hypothetical protein
VTDGVAAPGLQAGGLPEVGDDLRVVAAERVTIDIEALVSQY